RVPGGRQAGPQAVGFDPVGHGEPIRHGPPPGFRPLAPVTQSAVTSAAGNSPPRSLAGCVRRRLPASEAQSATFRVVQVEGGSRRRPSAATLIVSAKRVLAICARVPAMCAGTRAHCPVSWGSAANPRWPTGYPPVLAPGVLEDVASLVQFGKSLAHSGGVQPWDQLGESCTFRRFRLVGRHDHKDLLMRLVESNGRTVVHSDRTRSRRIEYRPPRRLDQLPGVDQLWMLARAGLLDHGPLVAGLIQLAGLQKPIKVSAGADQLIPQFADERSEMG